jgi:hypothetical protein
MQKEMMNISKKFFSAIVLVGSFTIPAFAGVIVNTPANNSQVGSPFSLSAYTSLCGGQQVSATGYSLDSSPNNTIFKAPSITTTVSASTGGHVLHVKAWGVSGAACVTDVAITVATSSMVPSYASSVSSLQTLSNWTAIHYTGTPGSSSGWSGITSSPSRSGAARQFTMSYSYYGGDRYSASFGDDESASNFIFDTWVYVPSPNSGLENLELDMNQVISGGQTVLYGMQCDGWSNTWDIAVNKGDTWHPYNAWAHTSAPCNIRNWSTNTWHHVQLSYSRNDTGWITYKSVTLDGVQQNINTTVLGAYNLGWAPILLVNVQLDGSSSGSSSATVFLDNLTIYRW